MRAFQAATDSKAQAYRSSCACRAVAVTIVEVGTACLSSSVSGISGARILGSLRRTCSRINYSLMDLKVQCSYRRTESSKYVTHAMERLP